MTVADFSSLRVGDPAVDLEAVSHLLEPEDFNRFFELYTEHVRHDDAGLRSRIDLRSEMAVLELLLAAVDSGDNAQIKEVEEMLADLAELIVPQGDSDAAGGEPKEGTKTTDDSDGLRPLSFDSPDDDGEATDIISR